jgi:dephospho-CoA kinase
MSCDRPYTVVLTGGIASGKTAVSDRFAALGVPVIDTDCIAREVVEPGQPALQEIADTFGSEFLDQSGCLDRSKMRRLIFSDQSQRERLEALLHPRIAAEVQRQIATLSAIYCILVIPLFAESGNYGWVDRVLVVDAPDYVRVDRIMTRDHVDEEHAQAMLAAQASREERLALADDIIENNGLLEELDLRVRELDRLYRRCDRSHTERAPCRQ